jgi:hypothetical protein
MEWYLYVIIVMTVLLLVFILAWLINFREANKLAGEVDVLMNRNKFLETQNRLLNEIVTPIKLVVNDPPRYTYPIKIPKA